MGRLLDMSAYPRRKHFEYFCSLPYPYVGVTVETDVSGLVNHCKETGRSFYLMFMHAAALAADSIPAFRQRVHGGGIMEYDQCPTSHTEMKPDGTYCYCTLHHHMPLQEYLIQAQAAREKCQADGGIQEEEDVESMYFISTLPWLHYSSLIQPVAGGKESNPRITWGRYIQNEQGLYILPVTVLAHHALVDGSHLALFFERLKIQLGVRSEELGV